MESKKRRHFPDAFKREAVERARTSGLTIIQVSEELGLHSHATPTPPKRLSLIENFLDLPCTCFTPPRNVQTHASEGKAGRFATNRQRLTDLAADAAELRKSKKSLITLFVKVATSCPMDWEPGRTKCRTE